MIRNYLEKLTSIMNLLSIVALVAILLIMFLDIVLRYVMEITVLGAYEIIEYLMVIAVAFCMAHTEVLDGHVKVTMLTEKFGEKTYKATRFLGYILQSAMLFCVMVANIQQANYIMGKHGASAIHKIPAFPFYLVISAGFGIFGGVMLLKAFLQIAATPSQRLNDSQDLKKESVV